MIGAAALLLLVGQAAVPGIGTSLGQIPRQSLPAAGCAAYLWTAAQPRALIAMAGGADGRLTLSLDDRPITLGRTGAAPGDGLGFAGATTFANGATMATLDLTVDTRGDLRQGAAIPAGTIRLERPGRDGIVMPVVGLIGCAN